MEYNKIISGGIAGLAEVTCTHPLDYIKTTLQQGNKPKIFSIYKGVVSRYIGIFPMRAIFWSTQNYGKNKFKNHNILLNGLFTGIITGTAQTIVDSPIESIKVNRIYNNKPYTSINLYKGFIPCYFRNIIFCTFSTTGCLINPTYGLLIGSSIGCILSQPVDYIKTIKQTGLKPHTNNYMIGWQYRAIISPINMFIGYHIFSYLSNNI